MKCVLALDQGTTSSRAIAFDAGGRPVSIAQRELRQLFPRPGWVEHDAEEIWSSQMAVAAEALARAPDAEIVAIGITNQRETTVLWDRLTGKPVANAIVWQDRRTASICDELREHEALCRARTGLVLDAYFSATKVKWLLDRRGRERPLTPAPLPAPRGEGTELAFGTIDTWLVWNLTKGRCHVTDATNASRTLLYDIHRHAWDDELLSIFGVPRALLPDVRQSSEIYGVTAEGLPIPAGIPIAGIAGDQQAALFGQRCTRAGMAKNTYGTGSFLVMHTGDAIVESQHGLLSTVAVDGYALEGSIFITGAAVQWLRDGLGIIKSAPEIEALAATVDNSDGVVFVPAFTGLGTPHWDPDARGTIAGITRGTTAAHLARATLESIALQTADVLDAMRIDSGIELEELRVDGGGSTNDLLMQVQADVAGIPVVRTAVAETTALGAAYLAGLAVGFWRNGAEINAQWKADRVFTPRMQASEREAMRERWREGVERAKGWAR